MLHFLTPTLRAGIYRSPLSELIHPILPEKCSVTLWRYQWTSLEHSQGALFELSWIFWGIQKTSLWSPCLLSSPFYLFFLATPWPCYLPRNRPLTQVFLHPLVAILEDGWIMHRPLRHRLCANNVGMSRHRHPIPLSNDMMEDIGRCWLSTVTAEILMSIEADFPPPSSHCQPFHPFSITWYGPPEPRASRQRRGRGRGRSTTFSICHKSRAAHYARVLRQRLREYVQPCVYGLHMSLLL